MCSVPAKLLSAFSTFSSFSLVPLPLGLQPFPLKWMNHTHKRQHRRDPSSAGAARSPLGLAALCSGQGTGGGSRCKHRSPGSCIPGNPRGCRASGSARAPHSFSCEKLTLALKIPFSLGITHSKNCFHLRVRTSFQSGFAKVTECGKGEGTSLQHCGVSFKKLIREIYEQCKIHGQTSVNFRQSSVKEQKDFLAF